ncbi:ATP-binding protein, partial [Chloroflexota bacterium]
PTEIFRHMSPQLKVVFNINNLVSKRSVVFARAGYGKSNLIKYLIAELYKGNGEYAVTDKGHKIGTLIFDADGEYFWPDYNERPGLCDVPDLRKQIVVFTNRQARSQYYNTWKAGEVKLDIRDLSARDVIGIAISPDRQSQQNILKLKSLSSTHWRSLVDLIFRDGLQANDTAVGNLLGYTTITTAMAEIAAAKSNMFNVVNHLHDPNSQLISGTLTALQKGLIVVIDISLLSSTAGSNIAGLIMRKIFNYNQENFTGGSPPIPVNVVIEEAHSVLGRTLEESSPFVEWVKEGRKYDLGAILITQQPGSMAPEILSQSDNWFAFHLLSEGDASTLGRYNSHYSQDVLAHIIGEPIPGNCYMWSAPKQPFVLPVRIRNFESLYSPEVISDVTAQPFDQSPAIEIRKQAEETIQRMVAALKKKMIESGDKLSTHEFSGEEKTIGIYDGQLYYFIKEIVKDLEFEYMGENTLKPILMKALFGCEISLQTSGDREYHCVLLENWEEILGK